MKSQGSRRTYLAALAAGIAVIAASTYGVSLTQAAQSTGDAGASSASISVSVSVPDSSAAGAHGSESSAPLSATDSVGPTDSSSAPGSATSGAPTTDSSGTATTGSAAGSTSGDPAGTHPKSTEPKSSAPKSTPPASSAPSSTPPASSAPTTPASSRAPAPASAFKDGTYSAKASYSSPGGTEQLGVTVSLQGDLVIKSSLELLGGVGVSRTYQTLFQQNYAPLVTGKKVDTIKLGAVGGSSLTSGGFNAALQAIEQQARA